MRGNLCLAGIALAALGAFAAPAHADVWSKSYSLTGKPQLTLQADDGSITIVSRDQNRIDAHVTTRGWRIGRDIKIEEQQTGNTVVIRIRSPHRHFHLSFGNHNVRVELAVPRAADLDIHSGDGSINCESVSGNILLASGDGSISARGLSGAFRFHSGDGSINASGLDGSLDAASGDGRIRVSGRFDSLRLRSGDGSIEAEAATGSKTAAAWSLHTGDGSIRIALPADFAADLDAHTGDGRVTVDFPVTISGTLDRSSLRGKIGAGGAPLILRSGDGSIRIEKTAAPRRP